MNKMIKKTNKVFFIYKLLTFWNNKSMRGRTLGIKKSIWLILSLVINAIIFATLSTFALMNGKYNDIFYIFCLSTGIHLFFKSLLFKFDSSCYFGLTLFMIGTTYFLSQYLQVYYLYPAFITISFAFSSLVTGIVYKQPFQIFLAISLFFASLGLLLFLLKFISAWIFVAFAIVGVLLLVIRFFTL